MLSTCLRVLTVLRDQKQLKIKSRKAFQHNNFNYFLVLVNIQRFMLTFKPNMVLPHRGQSQS